MKYFLLSCCFLMNFSVVAMEKEKPDYDLELALALSLMDHNQEVIQMQEDEALAKELQKLEFEGSSSMKSSPIMSLYIEAQQYMQPFLEKFKQLNLKHKEGLDVHVFNKKIMQWNNVYPKLVKFHDDLGFFRPNIKPEAIFEQLQKSKTFLALDPSSGITSQKVVIQNINQLMVHIKKSAVEGEETKVNVPELLARIWGLIGMLGDEESGYTLFIQSLVENSQTKGGCYPGFAGRLLYLYMVLLNNVVATSGNL